MARKDQDFLGAKEAFTASLDAHRPALVAALETAIRKAIADYLAANLTAPFPASVELSFKVSELEGGSPGFSALDATIKFRAEDA